MARANLNIDAQINDQFILAQDSKNVRILKIKILGENLTLDNVILKSNTAEDDFNTILIECLERDHAAFILFCLTDDINSSSASAVQIDHQDWLLIAWVPDTCRVRDKMLYSSSREDLKKSLGLSYFKAEYSPNQHSDICWSLFQSSIDKQFDVDILTESERLLLEEKQLIKAETSLTKSTALGVLPFELTEEVMNHLSVLQSYIHQPTTTDTDTLALENFNNDPSISSSSSSTTPTYNWLELNIVQEVIHLVSARIVKSGDSLQPFIDTENASFLIIKLPKNTASSKTSVFDSTIAATAAATSLSTTSIAAADIPMHVTFFVFSCPENAHIRMKMIMSSSKASVIAAAEQRGLKFDKILEIRDVSDIDELIRAELHPVGEEPSSSSSSLSSPLNASSGAATMSHSKPQRPGKGGKAKITKFKIED